MKKLIAVAMILCGVGADGMLVTATRSINNQNLFYSAVQPFAKGVKDMAALRQKHEYNDFRNGLPTKLISIEGVDGTGKSTLAKSLAGCFLQDLGVTTTIVHEPGGNKFGNTVCKLVKTEKIDPLSETLLLYAAFLNSYVDLIVPALKRGDCVICDRFVDSFYVYQMFGRGVLLKKIESLDQFFKKILPDITILLDANTKRTSQRILGRNQQEDEFDSMKKSQRNILRNAFMSVARSNPDRFIIVDANKTEEEVMAAAIAGIKANIKKNQK